MITAVDTNIILDILIPNEPFRASSQKLLERFWAKGKLILSEIVLAELLLNFLRKRSLNNSCLKRG